jgi:hypothetical protein
MHTAEEMEMRPHKAESEDLGKIDRAQALNEIWEELLCDISLHEAIMGGP